MTKDNMNTSGTEVQASEQKANQAKKPKNKKLIAGVIGVVVLAGAIAGGVYAYTTTNPVLL